MSVADCCIDNRVPLVTLNKNFVDFRQDGLELVGPPT
jgi:hypothetical protein